MKCNVISIMIIIIPIEKFYVCMALEKQTEILLKIHRSNSIYFHLHLYIIIVLLSLLSNSTNDLLKQKNIYIENVYYHIIILYDLRYSNKSIT